MAKSTKKQLLLAKVETTTGQDAAPTTALNAVLVRNMSVEPIAGDQVARELIRPFKGNSGKLFAGEYRRVTCEVEIAGSGTPGTAPAWGPLLQACGFAETVTTGTDVQYDPVSEGEPTLTLWPEVDGSRFPLLGAKGTVQFSFTAKGIPVFQFEFIGLYVPASEVGKPAGVDYKFLQPKTVGKRNTPTFTLHGLAACMQSYAINWAAQLAYRDLVNCASVQSPDRQPTGTAVIELPPVTTADWAERIRNSEPGAGVIVHGTDAGNIVEVQAPNLVPTGFSIQDDSGNAMANLTFDVNPAEGDDELRVIVR